MWGDGSSNEERPRTGRSYRTDRTEGISDGVFVHGLVLIAPRLGTFALSLAIVAYYWLVHHLISPRYAT